MLVDNSGVVYLKRGKEAIIKSKHPWIFSGAIDKTENVIENGQLVLIKSYQKKNLAIGSFSKSSQISVRIWSFNPSDIINKKFLSQRFYDALSLRKSLFDISQTNAYRVINSESDFLPGLIVDYYSGYYVVQFLSAGTEYFRSQIIEIISEQKDCAGIYERSDTESRKKENLPIKKDKLLGSFIPERILFKENGMSFYADIANGHKTGFYLDQRDNRQLLKDFSQGKNILNCFSYTGGFSVYAIKGNANFITNIDSSSSALSLSDVNHSINDISSNKYENIEGDVFKILRNFRDQGKKFDLIILDPPKFAESASNINKAARGYKDINLLAMKLLNENGVLFTFSCSGHISRELFHKIVNDAAIDSGREVKYLSILSQSKDHPILSSFPESLYLKGLVCLVN
jgi:23S rRNA (cytosine1962-C5)-methyltransferase